MADYYVTLHVDPRADPDVIEAAYRRLARKWHPDTSAAPDAAVQMQRLNEAYAVLRDPDRRRAYDANRLARGGAPAASSRGPLAPFVIIVAGVIGAVLGIRLLGAVARMPLLFVLGAGACYWAVRSLIGPRRNR
jgi:Flp pilus assembly protein TadB